MTPNTVFYLDGPVSQLFCFFEILTLNLDKSIPTDVVYLDFAKAFDSVPHRRLLLKLSSFGIEGKLLAWIEHFLVDRRQRVVIRGSVSS